MISACEHPPVRSAVPTSQWRAKIASAVKTLYAMQEFPSQLSDGESRPAGTVWLKAVMEGRHKTSLAAWNVNLEFVPAE